MCEFCSVVITQNGSLKQGELIYCNDHMSIAIHRDNRGIMLVETDDIESHIAINFCPKCGKAVREEALNVCGEGG